MDAFVNAMARAQAADDERDLIVKYINAVADGIALRFVNFPEVGARHVQAVRALALSLEQNQHRGTF